MWTATVAPLHVQNAQGLLLSACVLVGSDAVAFSTYLSPKPFACRLSGQKKIAAADAPADEDFSVAGPRTFEDMMLWANKSLSAACAAVSKSAEGVNVPDMFRKISQTRLVFTTSYSGLGAPDISLPFLQDALRKQGCELAYEVYSCTDIDPRCRRVLAAHGEATRSEHMLGDLLDKISGAQLEVLQAKQDHFMELYQTAAAKEPATAVKKNLLLKHGRDFVDDCLLYLSGLTMGKDTACHCYKHAGPCKIWPSEDRQTMHVEVAGNTCTPWSRSGKQMGWLDRASIPCVVWIHSCRLCCPQL